MKKEVVKVPRNLILVISKKVAGYVPNSEKLIRELHLPFKLDLSKTDVLHVGLDKLDKIRMENLKAVIINTQDKPSSVHEHFLVRNLNPLVHYTAQAYKSMTEEEKTAWRNLDSKLKLSTGTYASA